ncbi:MAG: tetratricopeptide repeat protein, partial [Bacteroidetes bacterium]
MKITRNISLTLLILFAVAPVFAQKMSWKKHLKLAETAFKNAEYAEAGNHYREAWRQKTKKKELIYKAGEAFFIIRDYQNAADAFKHVKDENDKYPLIGLRYARCLKQSGQYDEASQAFVDFISKYQGSDKPLVTKIVQNEIRGCEMALEWMSRDKAGEVELRLLGPTVNTPETEFAPFPFSDEILYFSSTAGKRAEIYRTQKIDGEWTQAIVPESFPKIESGHFCNGTLTPDQKRFYFTICESVESWGGLTTRCDIYVTRRENNAWTTPEKLRDYINMEGVTTTHPFVVHKDDTEILYFSSNRAGGHGGMDLWYTTRSISSNDLDFTFPVNLGETINTRGDEITPYYDDRDGLLYFSSNGHPSAGGYDIFMAKGSKSAWADVENIGPPFNSPADDFFFVKSPSRKTGFLVSNRTFGMEKVTTLDEDIFEFDLNVERPIYAKGGVYDQESGELLQNVTVSLYERMPAGSKKLVTNQNFENGNYYFD